MKKITLLILITVMIISCTNNQDNKLVIGLIKPSLNHLPIDFGFNIKTLNKDNYQIRYFSSGWETNEALVAKKIDLAVMPFTYSWTDIANGKKIKIISFFERESDGIITSTKFKILADLKNKRIGVLRASTLDVFAEMVSQERDLNFELVYFRTPMDMAAALKTKKVDALSYYVPSIFKFSEEFHVIHWYSDDYPAHSCCDISVTQTALDNKQSLISNFMLNLNESTNQLNNSPKAAFEAARIFYNIPIDLAKKSLYNTKYILNLDEDMKNFEEKVANIMFKKEYIKRRVDKDEVYYNID